MCVLALPGPLAHNGAVNHVKGCVCVEGEKGGGARDGERERGYFRGRLHICLGCVLNILLFSACSL